MFLTKKILTKLIIVVITILFSINISAKILPNLGSNYSFGLSKHKEQVIGRVLLQKLYQQNIISNDELIKTYISNLGNKLAYYSDDKNQQYNFFPVNNNLFNAFAFFGGNIGVHLGAINSLETEGELAAVIAHEISHISQRHLARQIETNKKLLPISIIEAVAAVALGVPDLALVAIGSYQEQMLHYSRAFEKEADRVGIRVLSNAGFDPHNMPNIFYRMQKNSRFESKPPEYLITHPLYENRIGDARARADDYPYTQNISSKDFYFIKARVKVYGSDNIKNLIKTLEFNIKEKKYVDEESTKYALALAYSEAKNQTKALKIVKEAINKNKDNIYLQLLLAEIYAKKHEFSNSIKILTDLREHNEHPAIDVDLAINYLSIRQPKKAEKILLEYEKENSSLFVYDMLVRAYSMQQNRAKSHIYKARWHILRGEMDKALSQANLALDNSKKDIYSEQEVDALKQKIASLKEEQDSI